MPINPKVLELENLRRQLWLAKKTAGMYQEGLDNNRIAEQESESTKHKIQVNNELAAELEIKLKQLVAIYKQERQSLQSVGIIEEWVAIHLQVCHNLLRSMVLKSTEDSVVRVYCLGTLISELGNLLCLEDSNYTFSVNDYFLKDYDREFDRLLNQKI